MKTFLSSGAFLFILASRLHAQTVLLQDDFNGNSINSSIWNVSLPNIGGTSTAVESGGNLTITQRATIYSIQGFNTPYNITGNFVTTSPGFSNEQEQFAVYFESNFSIYSPLTSYAVPTGVMVDFNTLNPSIQQFDSNNQAASQILAQTNTTLPDGVSYNFDINVNGSLVSVYVNNSLLLSATSSLSTGNQIGFEDGIFNGDSTSVNDFSVTSVPEPGTYVLVAGIVSLLLAVSPRAFRKSDLKAQA